MSEFVNYSKRDITLPPGCKDLIDVLQQGGASQPIKSIASRWEHPDVTRGHTIIARLSEVHYFSRLLFSRSALCTLVISTIDKRLSIVMCRDESKAVIALAFVSSAGKREQGVREFLQRHEIALLRDHLLSAESGAEPVRSLKFSLAPTKASKITTELLRTVYNYTDESKLRFQYYRFG